jgi:SAM-dependent methyltransferase
MVRLTRSRYPDARVEHADARDLSAFADCTFALVVFSFNGIDGLAHEDRPKVHAAVRRVLRPGGLFAYSTHNLDHPSAGRPPWDRCQLPGHLTVRPLVGWAARLPVRIRSYRRLQALSVRGDGWAILVGASYDFGIVGHYVTLDEALRELQESGYAPAVEVYSTSGAQMQSGEDTSASPWFHLLARKPNAR